MNDEYRQALQVLEDKRVAYEMAEGNYIDVAYHELKAAEARVMAIINEAKVVRK